MRTRRRLFQQRRHKYAICQKTRCSHPYDVGNKSSHYYIRYNSWHFNIVMKSVIKKGKLKVAIPPFIFPIQVVNVRIKARYRGSTWITENKTDIKRAWSLCWKLKWDLFLMVLHSRTDLLARNIRREPGWAKTETCTYIVTSKLHVGLFSKSVRQTLETS